jgi:hypothetical protein
MALVTRAALKARLGIASGDTSKDDDLDGIIAAASGLVRSYLGYDPETTGTQTEYLAPLGAEMLTLRKTPPRAGVTLTAVWEATTSDPPVFDNDNLLTSGTDYTQERPGGNGIIRLNRNWLYCPRKMPNRLASVNLPYVGTVKVTYTMDLTDHLAVAKRAALMECMTQARLTYKGGGMGLVTSDGMDGASVSINTSVKGNSGRKANSADGFVSPVVAGMLDAFRLIAFV